SFMEPRNVKEAMTDPAWIDLMKEELLQFNRLDVRVLLPALDNIKPLTLKWLFKNKHDEENTIIRNKTRLVMRGIFLAYAAYKSFIVFQMDVKTAFLHVITEYLVNISKRRTFWSLNEDILKITILTTNTSYPSRKIRRIRACTHQRPQRKQDQYAVSREDQYAVLEI
ncbi:hypothetical protein Tco_0042115, partial [Tanacetum coccineum]